jgi:hypothetical protein
VGGSDTYNIEPIGTAVRDPVSPTETHCKKSVIFD